LLRIREEIPDAKEEDRGALLEQYHRNIAILDQLRASRGRPEVNPDSPYFAHLRLKEGERERDLCLGKATRIQRGVRIVDWRNAPVSRIFYRYQQGEVYEEELGGRTVEGEVVTRRTVTIRNQCLERVDSPEGVFSRDREGRDGWVMTHQEPPRMAGGEGTALRAHQVGKGERRRLGTDLEGFRRRADKRLPDIAGLIDTHQFELITQPHSGVVVVRGTAGSGKTTVALHRIAWMAYDDPQIDSRRTLLVVFSRALRDYVDHVLPALGVHHVQVRTFTSWGAEVCRSHFRNLPRAIREDTPAVVVRLKQHPVMLTALEGQVQRVDAAATAEQAFDDWVSALSDPDTLWHLFRVLAPNAFTQAELVRASAWCRDRIDELLLWLDGEREDVRGALDEEDYALLLRAWQLRVGPLRTRKGKVLSYRHIAIDEVQDFSPLEVRVLLDCADERKSVTLAGDTQQHVMQDAGFTSWTEFFGHLGLESTAVNTLRVAYRSTLEIVDFSLALLGELREDDTPPLATRSGPPVELFRFTDPGAAVAFLADALKTLLLEEPLASVAVLTPSADVSHLYHHGLEHGEVPRLRRVTEQDFTFAPGVEVTEIDQVKGLEFDYVILAEVNAAFFPDTDAARRLRCHPRGTPALAHHGGDAITHPARAGRGTQHMSTNLHREVFVGQIIDGRSVRDPFLEDGPTVPLAAPMPDGAWVSVEVRDGTGHARLLAEPHTALHGMYRIAARHRLDPVYPPAVTDEAAAWRAEPGIDDPALVDLTHLPFVTIDEETSRDLDQALFIEGDGQGYTVWYAVADAAWFVRPGSALFSEAMRRAATFYLPGLVVPMLPRSLSEDLVSLNPGVDRRALVFEVRLDRTGDVVETRIHRGRVRSRLKTWYDAVQAHMDGEIAVPGGDPEVAKSLERLREVGELRMHAADSREVVSIRRAEVAVSLAGKAGMRFVAMADCRNEVERYNEQISLLCNIEGARFLRKDAREDDHVQPVYRVHDPPGPERLARLARSIDALARLHRLDPDQWRWTPGERSLARYLDGLPTDGPDARVARAIHRQVLMSTGAAAFTTVPGRHHGVGADVYARFTAPMREMVGVFVHKETWEKRAGFAPPPPPGVPDDDTLREQIVEASNHARKLQRGLDHEANRQVLDQLFSDDLTRPRDERPARHATVMGVSRDKVHVQLDDPPIDVKVYARHLEKQRRDGPLRQGRDALTLRRAESGAPVATVGEAVRVRVVGRDRKRDRWILGLL
jgi:DNA helicase-2/ATP-dependent DNA helicase PcrA